MFLPFLTALAILAHPDHDHAATPTPAPAPAPPHPANAAINAAYVARVRPIFAAKCFDCHSDQTLYPWYHSLPLISTFIDDHIEEGREHLDLSKDFPFGGKDPIVHLLNELVECLEDGDMPPWSYGLMHWGSGLTGDEVTLVRAWVDESKALLTQP